jgi:hypothetical protein
MSAKASICVQMAPNVVAVKSSSHAAFECSLYCLYKLTILSGTNTGIVRAAGLAAANAVLQIVQLLDPPIMIS